MTASGGQSGMATVDQLAQYLCQHRDRYPMEALTAQLRKQGFPEADIEAAVRAASGAPAAAAPPPPAYEVANGFPVWRFRLPDPEQYRGVARGLEARVSFMPEGAVLCLILTIAKDPARPVVLCRPVDVVPADAREFANALAKSGKIEICFENDAGAVVFKVRSPCEGAKVSRLLAQAASYNAGLSALDGAAAVQRFVQAFAPAFQANGVAAAWEAVEAVATAQAGGGGGTGGAKEAPMMDSLLSGFDARSPGDGRSSLDSQPGDQSVDSEALNRVAGPELYARQVFRLLELPVDASAKDLSRRLQLVEMAAKTKAPPPPGPFRALPVALQDPERLREEVQRLVEPEERLVAEFFWFWSEAADDASSREAWTALSACDAGKAAAALERRRLSAPSDPAPAHNLAVLHHCAALDLEASPGGGPERDAHWRKAMAAWKEVVKLDAVWHSVLARVREMDDKRLTSALVRRLRAVLPKALLGINAQLAVRHAQDGRGADASRHLALMRGSGFPEADVEAAMAAAAAPLAQRIETLCETAKVDLDDAAPRGGEIARRLMEQAEPLLASLKLIFPDGGLVCGSARDKVALQSMAAIVRCSNVDGLPQAEILDLLLMAMPFASSELARRKIEENTATVQGNIKFEKENAVFLKCWFCQEARPEDASAFGLDMYQVTSVEPTFQGKRVHFRRRTFKVPRCEACAGDHASFEERRRRFGKIFGLCAAGALLPVLIAGKDFSGGALIGFGILAGIAYAVAAPVGRGCYWLFAPRKAKPVGHAQEFPAIAEVMKEGWKVGTEPPG